MISRKLALAVSLVAAASWSGGASALLPSVTPDFVFNISGASAQQEPLGELLGSFCLSGTLTTYTGSDDNWISYYCTIEQDNNPTIIPASLDGQNVLFNTRAAGGSIWGVVPVARAWPVEYMNIFNSNCSGDAVNQTCSLANRAQGLVAFAAGTAGFECPFVDFQNGPNYVGNEPSHLGTTIADTVCLQSDGGVSDVEPSLFSATQNFPGFPGGALTPAELSALTVLSEYGVIFGVSVNDRIYRQLQVNQGLKNYEFPLNPPALSTDTDGTDLSDVARPSLPKTAIASLFSGAIGSWALVDSSLDQLAAGMVVCRRVVGSGTQAANNVFLMGNPCLGASNLIMVSDPDGGGDGRFVGTQFVVNNSGSSDVERCHTQAQDGALSGLPVPADSIGFNAINRTLDADEDWRFVKIDGVDPTVDNAIAGLYPHVFEQTLQFLSSADAITTAAMTMVAVGSGDPQTITNASIGGVMALPANGFDWNNPAESPTWRGSRGGDSCAPITLQPDN